MLGRCDPRRLKPVVWRVLTAWLKAMPLQNCPGTNLIRVSLAGAPRLVIFRVAMGESGNGAFGFDREQRVSWFRAESHVCKRGKGGAAGVRGQSLHLPRENI